MAESELLKDFKTVWGNSCQSMWAELLSITMAEAYVVSNYNDLQSDKLLTDMFYAPYLKNRLRDLRKDQFLDRVATYKATVITNRVVILSASFETYFNNFLEGFIVSKQKLFDKTAGVRTAEGNKLFGEVIKIRGLSARVRKFGELAPAKIKSLQKKFEFLDDVYLLRNILAHRAGLVDTYAASQLKHVKFQGGDRISLSAEKLLQIAAPVVEIAQQLDSKLP